MEQNNKTPGEENDHGFADEVTREKIERHLRDINDKISEEDIMNVITNISSGDPAEVVDKDAAEKAMPPEE